MYSALYPKTAIGVAMKRDSISGADAGILQFHSKIRLPVYRPPPYYTASFISKICVRI